MAPQAVEQKKLEIQKNLRTVSTLLTQKSTPAIEAQIAKLNANTADLESDVRMLLEIESQLPNVVETQIADVKRSVNLLPEIQAQLIRNNHSTTHYTPNTDRRAAINQAFNRAWNGKMTPEQRDLVSGIDTAGGAVVPQEFFGSFVEALKFYGPIASKALLRDTSTGRSTKVPVVNDTGNGFAVAW